jgi:hypothetical protein
MATIKQQLSAFTKYVKLLVTELYLDVKSFIISLVTLNTLIGADPTRATAL